ncbi:MAG TPA: T9SS type A sorting domain-containing protein, partial [Cytophagales bacterium]|nr:T9SS type A sorting domain-containing protein [Cytophagales bacterium]
TIPATPCTTPLKLLDFSLRNTASGITITWTTAQDDESRMFELQKSSNGLNFETFTSLPAQSRGGIHDYVITDYEEPSGTIVYYRLIQIDKNEHRKTLGTQSMMLNKQDAFVESHPNPFNEKLQIKALKHLSSVEIFDSSGKYLLVVSEVGEHTTLEINATAWSQGLYILKTTIEGEQFYQKLVK